jgi:hypothetical protein
MYVNGDAIRQPVQPAGHPAKGIIGIVPHDKLPDGV